MAPFFRRTNTATTLSRCLVLGGLLFGSAGCGTPLANDGAAAQPRQGRGENGPAAVDVAIARTAPIQQDREYTGTTQPYRDVSVRARIEGQLLELGVDVGDRVSQGQVLGRLDDNVLTAAVAEAEAELSARESEVVRFQTEISSAETAIEDAKLKLQQAQSDLARLEELFRSGAIPEQQVENARTVAGTARQAVRSAEKTVRTRQQVVSVAQRRVIAQRAIVAQEEERRSYTVLTAPVTGFVMERPLEPGNLAQPGSEVLKVGDFSQVKVNVQVSERELGTIRVGQSVQVKLDAFPSERLTGQVSRISPAADPTARLIPIEVIMPNSNGRIGSGLLARVQFSQQAIQQVMIPEAALQAGQDKKAGRQQGQASGAKLAGKPKAGQGQKAMAGKGDRPQSQPTAGTVFVVTNQAKQPTVEARPVSLGKRRDGLVEVLAGLQAGDRYVVRSSKALKQGAPVRLSVLSEGKNSQS